MSIPAREDNLHHLLRSAAYGGVCRNTRLGLVWVDGETLTCTDPRFWGVATLNAHGWLLWWPDLDRMESCCLSPLGNQVLDAWDTELWNTPVRRPYSSRPLAPDSVLADELGVSETEIATIRALFAALDHKHEGTET